MKIMKVGNSLLRSADNKILKVRPDEYIEPMPDVFMVQIAVEEGQTITLPTPNLTAIQPYVDLFMEFYNVKDGVVIASDDNSSGNSQPQLTRTLLANTEYYVRITNSTGPVKEGVFNIQVTGNGTASPTTEAGVTSLVVGTVLTNQYHELDSYQWFKFKTTAAGSYTIRTLGGTLEAYNYDVAWGDGNSNAGINTWNHANASHTYTIKGSYILNITGRMPGWSVNNTSNIKLAITKVISWGDVGLRKLDFYGCTALTTLPDQQSKLANILNFLNFCAGCTSLVAIPYGTFFGTIDTPIIWSTSMASAFYNCQSLRTLHSSTFRDCAHTTSFASTFAGNIRLTNLPDLLFTTCWKVIDWSNCFGGCTTFTSIPSNLFYREMQDINYANIANSMMFATFAGCSSLTTLPSELFSSSQTDNLGVNKVKGTNFSGVFAWCSLLNNLPSHIFHNQIYCTTASGAFYGCGSLQKSPVSCFEGCTIATSLGSQQVYTPNGISYAYTYGIFGACSAMNEVQANCFKECYAATDYAYTFYQTTSLVRLPLNLFDDSPNVLSFNATFYNSRISSWSADPDLTKYQLNPEIFKYNVNAITFTSTFSSNPNIKDLPEILFSTCVKATDFYATFNACTNLTIIPSKLFRYNPDVLTFMQTFYNCPITKIPIITEASVDYGFFYFNPQVRSFMYTFYGCKLANTLDASGNILTPAIPAITFLGNAEVYGNYAGGSTIGSFYGTFANNTTLQSVPDELFKNCTKATDFSYLFQSCSNVAFTSLPANLFLGVQNADTFTSAFSGVPLTSVPSNLFESCVRVSNFSSTFSNTKVISVPSLLFSYSGSTVQTFASVFSNCTLLTTIESDVFRYNTNATSFGSAFAGCNTLENIPQDIFRYNPICSDFSGVFGNCTYLADPKLGIFKYCIGGTNFNSAFSGCTRLIPESTMFYDPGQETTRFLNKVVNFTSCFSRTSWNLVDLYMGIYTVYNGTIQQTDDSTAGNNQPQITRTLLANTEYYIKITVSSGQVKSGLFNIQVTGDGTAVPTAEGGITSMIVGTPLYNQSMPTNGTLWFKFKTTAAGSYVIKTMGNVAYQGTAPDLWNCTFNFTPTRTQCWGGAGNSAESLSNYVSIPTIWKT